MIEPAITGSQIVRINMSPRVIFCSKQGPLPNRGSQGPFIEIVEFAANRHSMRKPGYLDVGVLQKVSDVMGSCLAVYRRIQGKDDFDHAIVMRPRHQHI